MTDLPALIALIAPVLVNAPKKIVMQTSAPAQVPGESWKEVAKMLSNVGVMSAVQRGYPGRSPFPVPTYIVAQLGDASVEVHWQGYAGEFRICISPGTMI